MGVYIKGMEMPERCEDCFCFRHDAEYDFAYCNISFVKVLGHGNARLNNCPLVPVPPHGRMIDADEFLKRVLRTKCFRGDYALMLEELVGESTTIIPAEDGE